MSTLNVSRIDKAFGRDLSIIEQELCQVLKTRVISGLDAVRALAVCLVLMDHFMLLDHVLGVRVALGSIGVVIFFVLSGFLITSMLLREYRKTGGISLTNFYRNRAYRIFPTFYVCWVLTTVVECLAHQFDWKPAAASFFYFMDYWRAFGPADSPAHMFISWSLAIEEKFYLLWPLLLLWILRKRFTLITSVAAIILAQWSYRAILYLVVHVGWGYMYYPFEMRADALLVGCLLAIVLENDRTRFVCCRLLQQQWLAVLPPVALLSVAIVPPANPPAFLVVWSMEPLIVAVMLVQAIYWGWKSWTVCSSAFIRMTAHLSYALYLYHPLAGKMTYYLHARYLGYSTAVLTLLMAFGSYYLVERPFMRLRDRV